jgi:hypothetical protein
MVDKADTDPSTHTTCAAVEMAATLIFALIAVDGDSAEDGSRGTQAGADSVAAVSAWRGHLRGAVEACNQAGHNLDRARRVLLAAIRRIEAKALPSNEDAALAECFREMPEILGPEASELWQAPLEARAAKGRKVRSRPRLGSAIQETCLPDERGGEE